MLKKWHSTQITKVWNFTSYFCETTMTYLTNPPTPTQPRPRPDPDQALCSPSNSENDIIAVPSLCLTVLSLRI